MTETLQLSKLSFAQIRDSNKCINQLVYKQLQDSLKSGDTDLLLTYFTQIFEQFCNNKETLILKTLLSNLNKQPLDEWTATLFPIMDRLIACFDTSSLTFFDQQHFAWIDSVENKWAEIMSELNNVLTHSQILPSFQEVQEDQKILTNDNLWKVIIFKAFGENFETTATLFPKTIDAINLIEDHSTAMISILEPGKHIRPHTGLYKGVLRYHLGLSVPPNTGIRVNNMDAKWHEGKSLVFDDTFEHEAWNQSNAPRAVLFVDFLRPLPFPLNVLNKFIVFNLLPLSDFVKKTVNNETKYQELINLING